MSYEIFRDDNTSGYTTEEIEALNREAETRIPELMELGLEEDEAIKAFSDEVNRR